MPEFNVKEVRLPELHLPEIHRDEIVRTLAGVRLPEVDLARARNAKIRIPAISLTANDVGRIVGAGAAITRFVRPAPRRVRTPWNPMNPFSRPSRSPVAMIARSRNRRSRRPILFGVLAVAVVAVVAVWAILRQPATRHRIAAVSRDARERLETWRAQDLRPAAGMSDDLTASEADILALGNATTDTGPLPEDGAANPGGETDGVPAFEESQTPA